MTSSSYTTSFMSFQLWCPFGTFFVQANARWIKEFLLQTCRATREGQPLVFLLQRIFNRNKMEAVTTKGISRMWFGIFCFMGPLHCYLAVEQRTWGCHFAWHQQRHWADSVSTGRSQVERGLFLWDGEMVIRQHQRGMKIQADNQNLSALSPAQYVEYMT